MRAVRFGLAAVAAAGILAMPWGRAQEPKEIDKATLDKITSSEYVSGTDEAYRKMREAVRAEEKKAEQETVQAREKLRAVKEELDAARKKLFQPLSETIKIGDEEVTVTQPESAAKALGKEKLTYMPDDPDPEKAKKFFLEYATDDFNLHEHELWSLDAKDFSLLEQPRFFHLDPGTGEARRWWGFAFSITNTPREMVNPAKARGIAPVCVIVTDKGTWAYQVGGFVPQKQLARELGLALPDEKPAEAAEKKPLLESTVSLMTRSLKDGEFKFEPAATFQPDQTRRGVAVWPVLVEDFKELSVLVHGLTNAHKYHRCLERVLVLSFERKAMTALQEAPVLRYKGKQFRDIWMWEQEVALPAPAEGEGPLKVEEVETPAKSKQLLWGLQLAIGNSTGVEQDLQVKQVRYILRAADGQGLEVDVGGKKLRVEVAVKDDGSASLYKTLLLNKLGWPAGAQRFAPEGAKGKTTYRIEPGKPVQVNAVFEAADIDWAGVRAQIEMQLSPAAGLADDAQKRWRETIESKVKDKTRATALLAEPGYLTPPMRTLTDDAVTLQDKRVLRGEVVRQDDQGVAIRTLQGVLVDLKAGEFEKVEIGEMSGVRKQILAALPAALEADKKKKQALVALDCAAGLASGRYRIVRSWRPRPVIDENWLKEVEKLGQ